MDEMTTTLNEVMDEDGGKMDVKVESCDRNLTVSIKGYEGVSCDEIILVELCEGVARVVIWADKEQEDPTHIIKLDGAKS